jgi:hypothetical protein
MWILNNNLDSIKNIILIYNSYMNKSKKSRNSKKIRGGGCGCSGGNDASASTSASPSSFSFFKGGSSCGGEPPSFTGVPLRSFYGGKDESVNPLYTQVASRLSGGKKSKKSKSKRKSLRKRNQKKIKGGLGFSGFMNSEPEFKLHPTITMV